MGARAGETRPLFWENEMGQVIQMAHHRGTIGPAEGMLELSSFIFRQALRRYIPGWIDINAFKLALIIASKTKDIPEEGMECFVSFREFIGSAIVDDIGELLCPPMSSEPSIFIEAARVVEDVLHIDGHIRYGKSYSALSQGSVSAIVNRLHRAGNEIEFAPTFARVHAVVADTDGHQQDYKEMALYTFPVE